MFVTNVKFKLEVYIMELKAILGRLLYKLEKICWENVIQADAKLISITSVLMDI